MNKTKFILFFSIVFIIFASINFYIIEWGLFFLPTDSPLRIYLIIGIVLLTLSYIIGRLLEKISVTFFSTLVVWIGAVWFGMMIYFFLVLITIDFIEWLNYLLNFYSSSIINNSESTKIYLMLFIVIFVSLISIAGFLNTRFPIIKTIKIAINKRANELKNLNIVMISDLHLGTIFGKSFLRNVVNKINSLNPDIILIPGDIVDEDISYALVKNVGKELENLQSKYGIFAVTGNHEFIGGITKAKKYILQHGIKLLSDEYVKINESFYLVGREDLLSKSYTNKKRKTLQNIIEGIDKTLPIILLDHQPFKLKQAVKNNMDLQLSGHTHHGQLFPFNFITKAIYEISMGYKKIGDTHFYVSSGIGGWGPPMRTVSRPEIVNIKINFILK